MALEGKPSFKETRSDLLGVIKEASPEQLLQLAAGTALRTHPLVKDFNNPDAAAFYQKTDDLRRLIVQEWKKHADFRGMIEMQMQMQRKSNANPEQTKR